MTAHFVEKRRPPFWLAALVIWPIFWPILGCATSRSSESQLQLSGTEKIKTDAEAVVVSHAAQGPTWIWEFAPPDKAKPPAAAKGSAKRVGTLGDAAGVNGSGSEASPPTSGMPDFDLAGLPEGLPEHGPLLKLTRIGPSTLDTTLQAKGTTETLWRTAVGYWAKLRSSVSYWPPWWLLGGAAAALAALMFFRKSLFAGLLARIFP